jgi:hypothetical protein
MMFMMPMPPHTRDGAQEQCQYAGNIGDHVRHLREIHDFEIVCVAFLNMPALAQQGFHGLRHMFDVRPWLHGYRNGIDVLIAHQPALHRTQRRENDIVLVIAESGLPFGSQLTNHLA